MSTPQWQSPPGGYWTPPIPQQPFPQQPAPGRRNLLKLLLGLVAVTVLAIGGLVAAVVLTTAAGFVLVRPTVTLYDIKVTPGTVGNHGQGEIRRYGGQVGLGNDQGSRLQHVHRSAGAGAVMP